MDPVTYRVPIGSQQVDLPIVRIADDLSIALMITVDLGVAFCERAGAELAALLETSSIEVVASIATMGIPIAIEVSRCLGLDQYVIFHKTPKIHLAEAVEESVTSITTATEQRLLFDRARIPIVEGRRVAVIDDVISTGASAGAALRLLRSVGAEPVALGSILTEGATWRTTLGGDAALVRSLGSIPVFRPGPDGSLREEWRD